MDLNAEGAIERIETLFLTRGQRLYSGAHAERVTALAHALQCAQLAEWAHADEALVAAALLHDVGHLLRDEPVADDEDDQHELHAVGWLRPDFPPAVVEPIRLHVAAKRYLCRRDPRYLAGLSAASVHSLALQGGVMDPDEADAFETLPHGMAAVQLRRWDDLAKEPAKRTPPLGYYRGLLQELLAPVPAERLAIGAD
jgi:phosphonate degradation associated HDIG domain protein